VAAGAFSPMCTVFWREILKGRGLSTVRSPSSCTLLWSYCSSCVSLVGGGSGEFGSRALIVSVLGARRGLGRCWVAYAQIAKVSLVDRPLTVMSVFGVKRCCTHITGLELGRRRRTLWLWPLKAASGPKRPAIGWANSRLTVAIHLQQSGMMASIPQPDWHGDPTLIAIEFIGAARRSTRYASLI